MTDLEFVMSITADTSVTDLNQVINDLDELIKKKGELGKGSITSNKQTSNPNNPERIIFQTYRHMNDALHGINRIKRSTDMIQPILNIVSDIRQNLWSVAQPFSSKTIMLENLKNKLKDPRELTDTFMANTTSPDFLKGHFKGNEKEGLDLLFTVVMKKAAEYLQNGNLVEGSRLFKQIDAIASHSSSASNTSLNGLIKEAFGGRGGEKSYLTQLTGLQPSKSGEQEFQISKMRDPDLVAKISEDEKKEYTAFFKAASSFKFTPEQMQKMSLMYSIKDTTALGNMADAILKDTGYYAGIKGGQGMYPESGTHPMIMKKLIAAGDNDDIRNLLTKQGEHIHGKWSAMDFMMSFKDTLIKQLSGTDEGSQRKLIAKSLHGSYGKETILGTMEPNHEFVELLRKKLIGASPNEGINVFGQAGIDIGQVKAAEDTIKKAAGFMTAGMGPVVEELTGDAKESVAQVHWATEKLKQIGDALKDVDLTKIKEKNTEIITQITDAMKSVINSSNKALSDELMSAINDSFNSVEKNGKLTLEAVKEIEKKRPETDG